MASEPLGTLPAEYIAQRLRECDDAYHAVLKRRLVSGQNFSEIGDALYMRQHADALEFEAWVKAQVPPEPEYTTPPRLRIVRDVFYTPDNKIWKWRGASAFQLLRDYLRGRDLTPVFEWARWLDINVLRVFSRLAWAPLRESDYTDEQLLSFVQYVGSQGFYLELVALADCSESAYAGWGMPLDQQRAHVERLARVCGHEPHVFLELGNEPEFNGFDPMAFTQPSTGVWSRGSAAYMTLRDTLPPWDYITFHEPRCDEWPMYPREAANCAWKYHVPAVCDEPVAMDIGGDENAWLRNLSDHKDFHALSHVFVSGSTVHTKALELDSVPPTGREQEGCREIVGMWDLISPAAQLGTYTAGHLTSGDQSCPVVFQFPDDPGCLRAFGTIVGNEATVVRVRGTSAPEARDGWRIVKRNHHIVLLAR